jgi:hypothetical protein
MVPQGYVSSKHPTAFMRLNCGLLFSHPEFNDLRQDITRYEGYHAILKVPISTVDRFLKSYKDKAKLKDIYAMEDVQQG